MTTEDQTTVSVEAHNRVTAERDKLKAEVERLTGVVTDIGLVSKAEEYFISKEVKDVAQLKQLADLALPHLRSVDVGEIPATLERVIPASMYAPPPPAVEPQGEPQEPAVAAPPPRPAVAGPDPAAPGTPPAREKIAINSPEMKERVRTQGFAALKAAIDAGEVMFDSQNEHAQRLAGG